MSRQGGFSTGDMADKIAEREPDKLREELKAKQKELGLRNMVPTHGQDVMQQLDDIQSEKNNILERMQMERERREKRTAEERKNKKIPIGRQLKMYFAQQERKAQGAYASRRILFRDGGFEKYEPTIRMMPFRVLLKEQKPEQMKNGIVIPDSHAEKYPRYSVIAVGDCCDGVGKGMTVLVEAYAGVEIVSGQDRYRIVTIDDILGEVVE